MSYEGELLSMSMPRAFNFRQPYAVIVTGDRPNPWGHMLLNTGGIGGTYFHVVGELVAMPRYMTEKGYRRYLKETGKSEIRRIRLFLKRPELAQLKLEQLLRDEWVWVGPVHNCETFVEQIIAAGDGPLLHRGVVSLPSQAGWSAWSCGARDCPTHSGRSHRCPPPSVWFCNRVDPKCPGHEHWNDICPSGKTWTCGAVSCPTHDKQSDQCPKGRAIWKCKRKVPPCEGHTDPDHKCPELGHPR